MPLYEYECDACGQRFELIQKFSDPAPDACEVCGKGPVHRQLSSPAIQFKGSGFYITDYAKKSASDDGGKSSSEKTSEKSGDSSKSDAKSDSTKSDTTKSDSSKGDTSTSTAGSTSKD